MVTEFASASPWKTTKKLSPGANVSGTWVRPNVLNEENGVLSWAPSGGLLASLDRQALTQASLQADPDQLLSILAAQPRSYFLTAAFKF